MKSRFTVISLCLSLTTLCVSALADDTKNKPEWRSWPSGDKYDLYVGLFSANLNTELSVDSTEGEDGTDLDLESDLGLEESKLTPIVAFSWRMAKRHQLKANYFRLDRSGTRTNNFTIQVGDTIFERDIPIDTELDIRVFELAYAYSVLFRERHNLTIGAGLSIQDMDLSMTASGEAINRSINERISAALPLPTLGLSYDFAILRKLILDLNVGWLAVKLNSDSDTNESWYNFDGGIWNNSIALRYKAFKHVGFNFAYQRFSVDFTLDRDEGTLDLSYLYDGPLLGVEVYF